MFDFNVLVKGIFPLRNHAGDYLIEHYYWNNIAILKQKEGYGFKFVLMYKINGKQDYLFIDKMSKCEREDYVKTILDDYIIHLENTSVKKKVK